ncbi:MAG: hypothetical protein LBD59_06860 [Prevotellaceae bacterium]|jgi:ABC-type phosphate/phosphonate transport system ATPase subunit|nr:hypothetical protein [Prevotellaceae bacterium]
MTEYQKQEVFIDKNTFNDGQTLHFNVPDIVVFTGANNAGKSQVLRDIEQYFQYAENFHNLTINGIVGELREVRKFIQKTLKS